MFDAALGQPLAVGPGGLGVGVGVSASPFSHGMAVEELPGAITVPAMAPAPLSITAAATPRKSAGQLSLGVSLATPPALVAGPATSPVIPNVLVARAGLGAAAQMGEARLSLRERRAKMQSVSLNVAPVGLGLQAPSVRVPVMFTCACRC
jgi:hypothetical protein